MSDQLEEDLLSAVEGTAHEGDLEFAKGKYNEAMGKVEERIMEDLPDEDKQRYALQFFRSEIQKNQRTARGQEMELHILAIGARQMEWSADGGGKKDVVISYGTVHAPNADFPGDVSGDVAECLFINDETVGVDPANLMSKFGAGNTLEATYSVSESSEIDGLLRAEATGATKVTEEDLDTLPVETRDDRNEILRTRIPETTIADAPENLASFDPESGYAHEFGADLVRLNCNVRDYYVDDEGGWGRYTVMDDSVTEDSVQELIMGEDQQTPGLTVWADPNYHIEYGISSQLDIYGYLETGQDGNVQMNAVGIVPIVPMPLDGEEGESADVNKTESTV